MTAYIFDTETTGPNPDSDQIIEAAWIALPDSSDLTGKPDSGEFALPDDVSYLIGHKVDFDWGMAGKPDVKRICTLALSRYLYPEAGSHTQSAMVYLFARMTGREAEAREALRNAHAALDDVINCGRVLQFLLKKALSQGYPCSTWEDIYLLSEAARIPKVINFGKHKGMAISELPAAYKTWLSAQDGIDPYLLKALTM